VSTASVRAAVAVRGPAVEAAIRFDAVAVLTAVVVLLVAIPSGVVVPTLGSIGTPAILAGVMVLFWWAVARLVPALGAATGRQPVRIVVFIFAGAALASFAAAMARPMADVEARSAYRGLITAAFWLGIALLAADGIVNRGRLEVLLRRLVVAGTILAALGIVQYATAFNPTELFQHLPGLAPNTDLASALGSRSSFRRVEGTAAHPIEFSVVLAMILPFAFHFALYGGPRRRLARWLGVAIISAGIILSISRSGILAMAVVGLALAWGWPWRWRLQALAATVASGLLVYLAVPGMVGTLRDIFLTAASDTSVTGRTARYAAAFDFVGQAPIFGRGLKTFIPALYFVTDNQYLATAIEMGVVGLAALLLLLVVPFFAVRAARRRTTDPASRHLAQALAASALVPLVTCATFDVFSYQMVSGFTFLILGCCGALWRLQPVPIDAEQRP
jgi:O-antigen ligase